MWSQTQDNHLRIRGRVVNSLQAAFGVESSGNESFSSSGSTQLKIDGASSSSTIVSCLGLSKRGRKLTFAFRRNKKATDQPMQLMSVASLSQDKVLLTIRPGHQA